MKIPWSKVGKRWHQQRVVQFREKTCQHLSYASYPEESSKNLVEAMKIPLSTVGYRWPQQAVVQFREPTCQRLSYASNPGQNPKNLMEALKSLSSRAQKRLTH